LLVALIGELAACPGDSLCRQAMAARTDGTRQFRGRARDIITRYYFLFYSRYYFFCYSERRLEPLYGLLWGIAVAEAVFNNQVSLFSRQ